MKVASIYFFISQHVSQIFFENYKYCNLKKSAIIYFCFRKWFQIYFSFRSWLFMFLNRRTNMLLELRVAAYTSHIIHAIIYYRIFYDFLIRHDLELRYYFGHARSGLLLINLSMLSTYNPFISAPRPRFQRTYIY